MNALKTPPQKAKMRLMYYLKHNLYVDRNTNILVYIKNINVNAVKVVQIVPFYSDKNT